jgi:4a-hydroxytetrahydrobiopterin dehydratase
LSGEWKIVQDKLRRVIVCRDFVHAISIINQIAAIAEEENHHPDLELVDYNKLRITLFTHDEGRVTLRDERLAERIENEVLNS